MALPPEFDFRTLSVADLLEAREQYQVALSNMENVVATAVGRYRFRPGDRPAIGHRHLKQPPRTLLNSSVTKDSLPCVLVFVRGWMDLRAFEQAAYPVAPRTPASENMRHMVPKLLFMPDGRVVPTCVVCVAWGDRPLEGLTWADVEFPCTLYGGGYGLVSTVQNTERVGTASCLVTDGEQLYVLTAKHVAGEAGRTIYTRCRGEEILVGTSAGADLGPVPFSEVYPGWGGARTVCVQDCGLVRLDDADRWTAQIFSIGQLSRAANLNTTNISLDLIGARVRSYGARSHEDMVGEICGLFPRYKSMGGVDYVADLLIGPRAGAVEEFQVHPGDSGSLWVDDSLEPSEGGRVALAVNWGALDLESGRQTYHLALASFLSQVCRRLNVDLVTGHNIGYHPVWAKQNHLLLAECAATMLPDASPERAFLWGADDSAREAALKTLSAVPDLWKHPDKPHRQFRRGKEGPSHYASVDLCVGGKRLGDCDLDPKVWKAFYEQDPDARAHPSKRGILPFRVWQVFDDLLRIPAAEGDLEHQAQEFFCACGVLSHYIADVCNPAHVTRWGLGHPVWGTDEWLDRHPDWREKKKKSQGRTTAGGEFHHLWDALELTADDVRPPFDDEPPVGGVATGQDAGRQALRLMVRTAEDVPLAPYSEEYAELPDEAIEAVRTYLTKEGKMKLASCMAQGCQLLHALWQTAWAVVESKGVADAYQGQRSSLTWSQLEAVCWPRGFLQSVVIGDLSVVNGRLEIAEA